MSNQIRRLTSKIVSGQDWLREVWTNGSKTVETIIPPQFGQGLHYGKQYDVSKSRKIAEKMLCQSKE